MQKKGAQGQSLIAFLVGGLQVFSTDFSILYSEFCRYTNPK